MNTNAIRGLKEARTKLADKRDELHTLMTQLEETLRKAIEPLADDVEPYSGAPFLTLRSEERPDGEPVLTLVCCGEFWVEMGISFGQADGDARTWRGFYAATNVGQHSTLHDAAKNMRGLRRNEQGEIEFMVWTGRMSEKDGSMLLQPYKMELVITSLLDATTRQTRSDLTSYNAQ